MKLLIVPARKGSKRIKDKNIIKIDGIPMFIHSMIAAKKSEIFDVIHLSTDSEKYANIAKKYGFDVIFLRNKKMGKNNVPIIEVLKHDCLNFKRLKYNFTDICMLTATSPLIQSKDLIKCKKLFEKNNRKFPILSVAEFPANIERAFKLSKDNTIEYIKKNYYLTNSQFITKKYYDTGNIFYFDFNKLLKFKDKGFKKLIPYILSFERAVDINEKQDLIFAKKLYYINKK